MLEEIKATFGKGETITERRVRKHNEFQEENYVEIIEDENICMKDLINDMLHVVRKMIVCARKNGDENTVRKWGDFYLRMLEFKHSPW